MELGGSDRARALQLIHDLRNALGAVVTYAHLVATDLADRPDAVETLSEIQAAGQQAAELAAELAAVIVGDPIS